MHTYMHTRTYTTTQAHTYIYKELFAGFIFIKASSAYTISFPFRNSLATLEIYTYKSYTK